MVENAEKTKITFEGENTFVNTYDTATAESSVFYAKDDTAYSMMYGKDTVTIVSNFLGTDCTYIVSTELNETLSEHFPYYYNYEYKLYIHGIGTENFETGWLRDGWDYVTDTYILMAEMDCETMSIDTVKNYKKEHYKD